MIRGVSFKILPSDNVLWQILKCIDVEKYCWYNIESQNEVWANYDGGASLEKEYYDGICFLHNILSQHFVLFLKLQAYLEKDEFYDIHTYEDFHKSDCQLLLLVYDCKFVDIYVKERIVAKTFYENALINNYTDVKYITESNDGRTKMDVL